MPNPFLPDLRQMETQWTQRGTDLLATLERLRAQLTGLDWRSPAATIAADSAHASLAAVRRSAASCLDLATALHAHAHRTDQVLSAARGLLRMGLGHVPHELTRLGVRT